MGNTDYSTQTSGPGIGLQYRSLTLAPSAWITNSTITTTAAQIWPYSAVNMTSLGVNDVQTLIFTNTHASNTAYIGGVFGMTTAAGGGWSFKVGPGETLPLQVSRDVVVYAAASASGTNYTLYPLA